MTESLVAACQGGERQAFDILVERHRRTVYHVCFRFTGNHADASDLAQDTFVRAYRALGRFRGDAAVSTWLYRIAVNVCLNRAAAKTPSFDGLDPAHELEAQGEGADQALVRGQEAGLVKAAIAQLPDRQRATVILRVYHELPHEEIARVLGTSVGTAKANFFHALRNLRRLLGAGGAR